MRTAVLPYLNASTVAACGSSNQRVTDVRDAHQAEFRDYVAARAATLLRTAYLLTGNHADAEDLLQTALAKTYLSWDKIKDRGAVDSYVRRAMVNTHISWWRRRRVDEYPTDELPDVPAPEPHGSELRDALWKALGRLPRRQRAAVVLRYYEDLSEQEIASILGISVGTVKSTVSRAVAKLRHDAALHRDLDEEPPPVRGTGRKAASPAGRHRASDPATTDK